MGGADAGGRLMSLLYRCDHHDCDKLDEPYWHVTSGVRHPIIPLGWVTGQHGDFCSEECEHDLIRCEEEEEELERANTTERRRST